MERSIDPYFRVEVISQMPNPQQVIYAAMHQDENATEIPLTNRSYPTFVSQVDALWVKAFDWYELTVGYAARAVYDPITQKSTQIYLHKEIMQRRGLDLRGKRIDHKNTNKLDNRFENLRFATQSENMSNRPKTKSNTSGFKGVRFHRSTRKWQAYIKHEYRQKHLGLFCTPEEAALAYNQAALILKGEFAYLNEVGHG